MRARLYDKELLTFGHVTISGDSVTTGEHEVKQFWFILDPLTFKLNGNNKVD